MLIRMEVAFRSSEIAFFKESFILASGNGFSINYKFCAFIRSFFFWWEKLLTLGVNQFPSIFSIPNSGSSFYSLWKQIFYRILHSGNWKQIFCAVFFYSEQIFFAGGNHYSN